MTNRGKHWPEVKSITVLPKAFRADFRRLDSRFWRGLVTKGLIKTGSVRVLLVDDKTAGSRLRVHVLVIKGLKREPASRRLGRVSELDVLQMSQRFEFGTYLVEQ